MDPSGRLIGLDIEKKPITLKGNICRENIRMVQGYWFLTSRAEDLNFGQE